jgi:hypothetical protein
MSVLLKEAERPFKVRRGGSDGQRAVLSGLAAFLAMAALVLGMHLLVRYLFATSYLSLFFRYGYLLFLAFTFVALVLELDQERDLISMHPFKYAMACLRLMRGPLMAVGADFRRDTDQQHLSHQPEIGRLDPSLWGGVAQIAESAAHVADLFISGFFSIVFILLLSAWLVVGAPLQYFVFLICGAPARVIERSIQRAHAAAARVAEQSVLDVPVHEAATEARASPRSLLRPVRLSSALSFLVLWAISKIWF